LICSICKGTAKKNCPECKGTGYIFQSTKCTVCNGSGQDYSEVKNWSVERIRFELDTLEKDNQQCRAELRELEDYDDSDGRGAPVGIEINYRRISENDKKIETLRNKIRGKI